MIQIYRIENETEILHKEVCRDCAIKFKKKGLTIVYDVWFSEYYNDLDNESCTICEGDFKVDGRKIKKGDVKSNIWAEC